ncbi:MAG: hypothetical protein JNJ58_13040 [Chitinophagaceae bacterium]|nr:hypothetical protein [Chitinophagaceae bacterium]
MIRIGKIRALHGFRGQVVLQHELKNPKLLKAGTALLLEIWPESYIPFFIKEINHTASNECLVLFEETESREAASAILRKTVYHPDSETVKTALVNSWAAVIGFKLLDQDGRYIMQIDDILEHIGGLLIEGKYQGRDMLIPFSEDLLIETRPDKKEIVLQIAEGLLDL